MPENHGADFVITSKTNTVFIGTRILTPDPEEGQRILKAHRIHGLGEESTNETFEAPTQAFFDRSWKMGNIKEIN